MKPFQPGRRRLLRAAAAGTIAMTMKPAIAAPGPLITRAIPRSGERLPVVGLGTYQVFDIPASRLAGTELRAVLQRFGELGGKVIDSSPMYGHAEAATGALASALKLRHQLFYATKVWTSGREAGIRQMEESFRLMQTRTMDLMQVHNLLAWREHLKTLRRWKEEGRTRLLGVTTSHGNKHDEMERVLKAESHALEFMQITYNPVDRRAERLMQMATDRGLGVIVNRPFDGGSLLRRLGREPLPGLARDLECSTWAALVLKWELAFPPVTCVIPATTRADHVAQNLAATSGPLPDPRQRLALTSLFERLIG